MILAISFALLAVCLVCSTWPRTFVVLVAVLGPLPVNFLFADPSIDTPLGLINVSAFKVFCLLAGCVAGLALNRAALGSALRTFSFFAAFFVLAVLSLVWTGDLEMGIRMLLKLAMPLAFGVYVFCLFDRIGTDFLLRTLLVTGLGFLVFAVLHTAFWGTGRLTLPGTSGAVFSGQMLVPQAVAAALTLVQPTLLRGTLVLLFVGAAFAAFVRITMAGTFGVLGVTAFLRSGLVVRWLIPVLGIAAFVLLFLTVPSLRERMFLTMADRVDLGLLFEDPEAVLGGISGTGRFDVWSIALTRLFDPNPALGAGIGSAQELLYHGLGSAPSAVHSEIVRLLCDLGVVGLALYLLGWFQVLSRLARQSRRIADYQDRALQIAAVGASAGYLIFLLTDNGFDYAAQMGSLVFALVGAGAARAVRAAAGDAAEWGDPAVPRAADAPPGWSGAVPGAVPARLPTHGTLEPRPTASPPGVAR